MTALIRREVEALIRDIVNHEFYKRGFNDTNLRADHVGGAFDPNQSSGFGDMNNPMTTLGDLIYGGAGGAPTRRGIGSSGQVLTVSGGVPDWAASGGVGGLVQLAQTRVTGSDASTIDFTSISGAYSALLLLLSGRTDESATLSVVYARMNNDSGSNYDDQNASGSGTSATAGGNLGTTGANVGILPGASAPASHAGSFSLMVPDYAGTTFYKAFHSFGGTFGSTSTLLNNVAVATRAGHWRSTSAINRITLQIQSGGPTLKFKVGTLATLYGLT